MDRTVTLPMVLIIVIAAAAFFGFGAIFNNYGSNIGAQSTAAAFSALFVILATKVLLQQEQSLQRENESKKDDAERKRKVFEKRIQVYEDTSQSIAEILTQRRLTVVDINRLRNMALRLQLVASSQTVQEINLLAEMALKIVKSGIEKIYNNQQNEQDGQEKRSSDSIIEFQVDVSASQLDDLWKAAGEFVNACRRDLDMSADVSDRKFSDSMNQLLQLLHDFSEVDESIEEIEEVRQGVRSPLAGGVDEWVKTKSPKIYNQDTVKKLELFLEGIESRCEGVDTKITKTEITIRKANAVGRKKVIAYFHKVQFSEEVQGLEYLLSFNISDPEFNERSRARFRNVGINVADRGELGLDFPENYSELQINALHACFRDGAEQLK